MNIRVLLSIKLIALFRSQYMHPYTTYAHKPSSRIPVEGAVECSSVLAVGGWSYSASNYDNYCMSEDITYLRIIEIITYMTT